MTKNSIQNSTDTSALVNIDSPDDFYYEGKSKKDVSKAKNAKRLTKRKEEFSRIDNPDDIDANFSKKKD